MSAYRCEHGVVIKLFGVGNMKVNSLRCVVPEPLHCRFCGSAAISSFSVVYEIEGGSGARSGLIRKPYV